MVYFSSFQSDASDEVNEVHPQQVLKVRLLELSIDLWTWMET